MFCRRCGKQLTDNQEYCSECKKQMTDYDSLKNTGNFKNENYQQYTNFSIPGDYPPQKQGVKKKCCPNCRSNKLQVVPKTNFESKFDTKGYGIFKGCCGYLIFGPIGILCGLCGSKAKNSVKISSTNVWICHDETGKAIAEHEEGVFYKNYYIGLYRGNKTKR